MHTSRHFQCLRTMEAAINLLVTMDTILIAHFRISKLTSNLLNFFPKYIFVLSDTMGNSYWTILQYYKSIFNSKLTYQNNFRWHWVSSEFDGAVQCRQSELAMLRPQSLTRVLTKCRRSSSLPLRTLSSRSVVFSRGIR